MGGGVKSVEVDLAELTEKSLAFTTGAQVEKTWLPCHDHTMIKGKHGHDHAMMAAWRGRGREREREGEVKIFVATGGWGGGGVNRKDSQFIGLIQR